MVQPRSHTDPAERPRRTGVVPHGHYLAATQREYLRPARARAVRRPPGVGNGHLVACFAHILQLPVGRALPPMKLDP